MASRSRAARSGASAGRSVGPRGSTVRSGGHGRQPAGTWWSSAAGSPGWPPPGTSRQGGERVRVTVLEGAARIGGKLRVTEVAGVVVDAAPRRCWPGGPRARTWPARSGSATSWAPRRHPRGHLDAGRAAADAQGTRHGRARRPGRAGQVRHPVSPAGSPACRWTRSCPRTRVGADVSVAAYVGAPDGPRGGRPAGRAAARRCLRRHAPTGCRWTRRCRAIAAAARAGRSLLAAARADRRRGAQGRRARCSPPCGAGWAPAGGGRRAPSGAEIRTGVTVRELRRTEGGWRLVVGPARDRRHRGRRGDRRRARPPPASRLLAAEVPRPPPSWPGSSTPAWPSSPSPTRATAFPEPPTGSGYLVPPVDGRAVKAATFSSVKWPHLAEADPDLIVLRCSDRPASARRPCSSATTPSWSRLAMAEMVEVIGVRGLPGRRPGDPLGRRPAAVRRGPPRPGRPDPRARSPRSPAWRCAGRRTTGVGIPACVATAPHGGGPDSGPPAIAAGEWQR